MKPGTKSRKLGLQIPTVNPCNDFIVDYLIRNKIKSDKQVLCKSYLYNLAIQAVRKYPLPLVCEQQLAALQGFGNFFIGQVGRLIKRHYTRGRMPTEKQMEEDDQAHFEGLRVKKKMTQQKPTRSYRQDRQDSPIFKNSSRNDSQKRKVYRPKRNTEPMNILQSLVELNAHQRAVTKGEINQVLFNKNKEKIRLWYVLRQKLQQFNFIQLDVKDNEFIYLTPKGKAYVQNYDIEQKQLDKHRRKPKKVQQDKEQQQSQQQKQQQTVKLEELAGNQQQQKTSKLVKKQKQKPVQTVFGKLSAQLKLIKVVISKSTKYQSVDILINQRDADVTEKQKILQTYDDINYEFCDIQLADFLWTVCEGKILDYMAIRVKQKDFDVQAFKTICFRAKITGCQSIFLIIQSANQSQSKIKVEQETDDKNEPKKQLKQQGFEQQKNNLLCAARVSGFIVVKTKGLAQTIQFVRSIANQLLSKLSIYEQNARANKNRREKVKQQQSIKNIGTLDKFNKKIGAPFQLSTITNQCMKCIPDLSLKCIKALLDKFPTFAVLHKKTQDTGTTKQRKLFLKSHLLNQKVSDAAMNTLVQILFYQQY